MIRHAIAALVATGAALTAGAAPASSAGFHEPHKRSEIRAAAQEWVDQGTPYSQLTPRSQRLVSRSTWTAWARCDSGTTKFTASVRGHGNDLAVVRFSYEGGHTEWTAFYRGAQWTFELPGFDVERVRTHTAAQLAGCEA